jgi:hypothetical protein
MNDDDRADRPHRTELAARRSEDRRKRLSSTLRDNLYKRKRQAQAQAQAKAQELTRADSNTAPEQAPPKPD